MSLRLALTAIAFAAFTAGGAQAALPDDPLAASWTYAAVNLPAAWELTSGSPDVVIAIEDSGADPLHPDLADALAPGWNFVDENADTRDTAGHGTAVAGIVAARANGLGAVGACWSCRIMPLRVLRPEGFALEATMARGVDYAVEHGAAVVNISLYGENRNGFLHDAIERARAAGVAVVAAAGNEFTTVPEYPAAYPDAISVGATVESGRLANYSGRGDWVKVAAPACMPTTTLGGGFGAGCGTSGSTPLVAGIVALLRARAPYASVDQIEHALEATAKPVSGIRYGLVDAYAALRLLGRPAPQLRPVISGFPGIGSKLTVASGIWSGSGLVVSYRWERCGGARCDPAGDGAAHVVEAADAGKQLRAVAAAAGVATATSAETAVVLATPRRETAPSISGRPRVGATLTGRPGVWSGTNLTFTYTWLRCLKSCWSAKTVGHGLTYAVRSADRGARLKFVVTAANELDTISAPSALTARIR
jgi:subtilisin family serine protease